MKQRELFRLSIGEYDLTEGIYSYSFRKTLTSDGEPMYFLKEKGGLWHNRGVTFFEDEIEEEDFYKRKELKALSGIGGFCIHSDYSCFIDSLWDLKFVPRGSFKEFIRRTTGGEFKQN